MVKIVANAKIEATSLELVFDTPPQGVVENNLRVALEGAGFTVSQRPTGDQKVIWECELPFGDIVTEEEVVATERAIVLSGV